MVSCVPRGARVAGRWYFPAPSSASAVAGWPSRSSADSARPMFRRTSTRGLRGLRSRSELLSRPGRMGSDLPLVGFVRRAHHCAHRSGPPPSAWLPESTPARPRGRASASREPPSPHVPPSWFRTTSAVSSSGSSRACCVPLPILGFVAFPTGSTRFVKVRRPLAEPNTAFPATFVSLRRMSSTAAVPRHRGQSSAVESVTPHRRCQR
jgi:hypothetical protein